MPNESNVRQLTDHGAPIYPITDRSLVIGLQDNAFATYVMAWDGASTPVPANIPAGVVVTYNGTDYTGTLAASASTAQDLYLVASGSQPGEYDRYITTHVSSTYAWNALGSTAIVSPVIADDLVTNDSSKALSAKQGKILGDKTSELEAKVGEKINFGIITDADFIDGYRINANTGADQVDATRAISPYLPVSPGTVVTFSGNNPNNAVLWAIYNADKEMVDNSGTITGLTAIREDYIMPSNAAYIRFVRLINNGTHCTIVCGTKNIRYDVDSINQQIFGDLFLFRNGSVGNAGNAQYIFSSYIFPFKNYKKVAVYTNRPPADGNEYRFCFQTYSREVGVPSSEHTLHAYVRNVTGYSAANQSVTPNTGELGVGFGIGEFVKGTNTVVPIRVDDFANYDLFIYGITAEDEIQKADILAQTNAAISVVDAKVEQNTDSIQTITDAISSPEEKELTLTSNQAWNAKADTAIGATISRTSDSAFKSADAIAVEKGMTFRIGVRRYKNYYYAIFTDADNKFVAGDVLGGSLDSGLTYHNITVPEGATRLLINSYSSNPEAVWTNSFDAVKNAIKPTIISLNKDMEVAVNAASNFRYKPNNQNKMMSLLVSTDVHGDATRFARAMEYLDAIPSIDMGICLGDMAPASFAESVDWYISAVNGGTKPYLTVIGNHDAGNSASVSLAGTMQQIFDKFILPVRDKIGLPTLDKSYYSIQNDTYKVTVIVLDVYDLPDTMADENNFAVSRTTWGMSQAQVDWLLSTLASVPSNYTVLLAYHYAGDLNTKYVCDWSQKLNYNAINPGATYLGMLGDIINAWKTGTSINKSFAPSQSQEYLPTLSVSADFSSRGVGLFAAHLTGHIHRDYIGHLTEHPDQLLIGLAQTANDNNQNFSDLDRAIGTKAEDAITVLGINTINKTVNLVRIGANVTNDMVNRSFIALPY